MVFYGISWYFMVLLWYFMVLLYLNINQLIRLSGCGECTMINGF